MPLTKTGKKIKKSMEKEYGKKKWEKVFYAWENKNKWKVPWSKKKISKKK